MNDLLKEIYLRYGDFSRTGRPIQYVHTAIKILIEGAVDIKDLEEKIVKYDNNIVQERYLNTEYDELAHELAFIQPKSMGLMLIFISLILDASEDDYYEVIKLEKEKIFQIIISTCLYLLFLQTDMGLDLNMSKKANNSVFGRKDFYIGIDELKKVCWKIEEKDYLKFLELFAFDIHSDDLDNVEEFKLFNDGVYMFILWITDFLNYMLLKSEELYLKVKNIEPFSTAKGFGFEKLVYDLTSCFFDKPLQSVFYINETKKSEIDLVYEDGNYLIIIECKSGTIDLENKKKNEVIKKIIDNKIKKAYKTLDRVAAYVNENSILEFEYKDKTAALNIHKENYKIIYLHLTMYSLDSLLSSIQRLDDKYYNELKNPKISMSLEHFLAICIDCHDKKKSIGEYLNLRQKLIREYPGVKFDNNELDLYYQLTSKSMLKDSLENKMLNQLNNDIQIISSFHNHNNDEFRPASMMLERVDNGLMEMLIEMSKQSFGLNKRYINYMGQYMKMERE